MYVNIFVVSPSLTKKRIFTA